MDENPDGHHCLLVHLARRVNQPHGGEGADLGLNVRLTLRNRTRRRESERERAPKREISSGGIAGFRGLEFRV